MVNLCIKFKDPASPVSKLGNVSQIYQKLAAVMGHWRWKSHHYTTCIWLPISNPYVP